MRSLPDKLILIDGTCNFCHSTVKWVEKHSNRRDFFYANIQSETGAEIYRDFQISPSVDSVLFIEKGQLKMQSTAIFSICKYLRFPYNIPSMFLIVPEWLRDQIYKLIARNRYRLFGKKESCELPSISFKERVLL